MSGQFWLQAGFPAGSDALESASAGRIACPTRQSNPYPGLAAGATSCPRAMVVASAIPFVATLAGRMNKERRSART